MYVHLLLGLSSLTCLRMPTCLNLTLSNLNLPNCPYESDPQLKTCPHSLTARV